MIKKTIYVLLSALFLYQSAFSQAAPETKSVKKENILIANFIPKGSSRKYIYYADIIPATLTKNLKSDTDYIVNRKSVILDLVKEGDHSKISEYQKKFGKTKKQKQGTDFIIIGNCQLGEFTQEEMDTLSGKPPVDTPDTTDLKKNQKTEKGTETLEDDFDEEKDIPEEEVHDFTNKKTETKKKAAPTPDKTKNNKQLPEETEKKYRMLFVKLQIIDLNTGKVSTITKWSKEIGVLLKETTDDISDEIDNSIDDLISQRPVPVESNKGLYSFLSPFSIGVKYGILYPQGKLADQYDGDNFAQPYLNIQLARNFALSFHYLHAQFDMLDTAGGISAHNTLRVYMLETNILLWLGNNLHTSLNAGAGYGLLKVSTFTGITNSPASTPTDTVRDFRPMFTGGVEFKLSLSPIQLFGGMNYYYMMTDKVDEFSAITAYVGAAFQFK